MHNFLNNVEVIQPYECVVTWLKVTSLRTLEVLMLKIRRMWKHGGDGICFNNIVFILVETMYRPKLGEVRQLCVFIASCVLGMLAQFMEPS